MMDEKNGRIIFLFGSHANKQNYEIMEQLFRCIFKCDSSFYSKLLKLNEKKNGMTGYL